MYKIGVILAHSQDHCRIIDSHTVRGSVLSLPECPTLKGTDFVPSMGIHHLGMV